MATTELRVLGHDGLELPPRPKKRLLSRRIFGRGSVVQTPEIPTDLELSRLIV